ncbi:MAG: hypothetical protein H0W61_14210 [Bacteroidetes bacterium]|nr:hypothetical protein [Bacteroidota bacterium]
MLLKGFVTLLISLILSVLSSLALSHFTKFYSENYWFSLALFTGLFFILNFFYSSRTDFKSHSNLLLGTISVKLFILLVAIFLYSLYDKKGFFSFFAHFSAHYILFTVFEIRYLLQIVNRKQANK